VNIEEEARYQIRLGACSPIMLPTELVRDVVSGAVSSGAFATYAVLYCINDGGLGRPLHEIAAARGLRVPSFSRHLDQLEERGWLDRGVAETDQAGDPTLREFVLQQKRREAVDA